MKILLLENVDKVGKKGAIVNVKDGFARNYLFPKKLASIATKSTIRVYEEHLKIHEKKEIGKKKTADILAKKMNGVSITTTVTAGEDDKIFGSVTTQNISDLLKEKGFDVDKKNITISDPIKSLGVYNVIVKVYKDTKAEIKRWVIKE